MKRVHLFLTVALIVLIGASAQAVMKTEIFDSDPGWSNYEQAGLGWSDTDLTGQSSPAGEGGGFITCHSNYRRFYGDTDLGGSLTLAQDLSFSCEFIITDNGGDSQEQCCVGFFDATASNFQNSLGIVLLDKTSTSQRICLWATYSDNTTSKLYTDTMYIVNHNNQYTLDMTWVASTKTVTMHVKDSSGSTLHTLTKTLTDAQVANMGSFNTFGLSNCIDNTAYGTSEASGITMYIDNATYTSVYSENSVINPVPASSTADVDLTVLTALSWTAPTAPGTYMYDVYLSSPSNPNPVLVSGNQSGTSYTLPSSLAYGTTYYWRVDTKDSGGTLLQTGAMWQFTTGGGVSNPTPADGSTTNYDDDTITLTWDSSLANNYDVYMGNSSGALSFVANTTAKELQVEIDPNTLYYWRVDTKDSSGALIAAGPEWTFTTGLPGEILYNGIVLPSQWPPNDDRDPYEPMPVPYLDNPPSVIPIDVGRQLFVDDFLIQETTLSRTYHLPQQYPDNPVIKPDEPWEFPTSGSSAGPYSGGAWFDPSDNLFKLWYTGGYLESTCYATSADGIHWNKPSLDVIEAGTNMVLKPETFDSTTVWLDEQDPQARFKYFATEWPPAEGLKLVYRTSPDGLRWSEPLAAVPKPGDRTTVFYNPFRKVWVLSERTSWGSGRARAYSENADPQKLVTDSVGIKWLAADNLDPHNPVPEFSYIVPQLYNFDAVAYESLMLGLFTIWQGPDNSYCAANALQKRNEVLIGYSRDGFHWSRPDRNRFISCTWDPDNWRFGNVQSTGGGCLVVGDKIYFYFSARAKPDAGFYTNDPDWVEFWDGAVATGLAVLRRDGFASMDAGDKGGTLTTRPITFNGSYLFVNVDNPNGTLQAEVLNANNEVVEPFTKENCISVSVEKTLQPIRWNNISDLSSLAGENVRFKFYLTNGSLYSFWVSPDRCGTSRGYVAAGGPDLAGPTDAVLPLVGDLNRDCAVDMEDFAILAANWLGCARPNGECP